MEVGKMPPEAIISHDKPAPSFETEINAVHYKNSDGRWTKLERPQQVVTKDEKWKKHNWDQNIQNSHKFYRYCNNFSKMVEDFEKVVYSYSRRVNSADFG